MKPSLTGDESAALRLYREEQTAFPNDPTIDQFFAPERFEAYRQLGEHVGESLWKKVWSKVGSPFAAEWDSQLQTVLRAGKSHDSSDPPLVSELDTASSPAADPTATQETAPPAPEDVGRDATKPAASSVELPEPTSNFAKLNETNSQHTRLDEGASNTAVPDGMTLNVVPPIEMVRPTNVLEAAILDLASSDSKGRHAAATSLQSVANWRPELFLPSERSFAINPIAFLNEALQGERDEKIRKILKSVLSTIERFAATQEPQQPKSRKKSKKK